MAVTGNRLVPVRGCVTIRTQKVESKRVRKTAMQYLWVGWLLLAVLFVVAEVFTTGFVLFWFGIGAALAMVVSLVGGGLGLQVGVFLLSSVVLTALSRTIFLKYLDPGSRTSGLKLGAGSLPGQVGTVVTASNGVRGESEIKVYGSVWRALPEDTDISFEEGQEVEVVRVDGTTLYVRPLQKTPEWRMDRTLN